MRGESRDGVVPGEFLGVTPFLGRAFTGAEAASEAAEAVVSLGHALWTSRYNADSRDSLAAPSKSNRRPTRVGVLPAGFKGLIGNAEAWVPFAVFTNGGPDTALWRMVLHGSRVERRAYRRAQGIAAGLQSPGSADRRGVSPQYRNAMGKPWSATAASLYSSRGRR